MREPQNLRVLGDRMEQMLDDLQAAADPRTYERAEELLRLITELYGAALERVVEVAAANAPGVVAAFLDDDLISSLLIVHGLHPDGVDARVQRALADVRPFLAQHGGDVELLELDPDAGAVLLRLLGSCDGCPSSAVTLQHAVERAITEAAPEIVTIDVAESPAAPPPGVTIPVTLGPRAVYDACPSEVGA